MEIGRYYLIQTISIKIMTFLFRLLKFKCFYLLDQIALVITSNVMA